VRRPDDLLEPLRAEPRHAAVLVDFDGTLAPIVADPLAAVPLPGTADVLRRLTRRYALAGVVSGRPVSYLLEHLGPGIWLSGLYGLEAVGGDGRTTEAPGAARWRPRVVAAVADAAARFPGLVEDKGLSMTLHFRTAPADERAIRDWAAAEAARTGLVVRSAKASVELHPPLALDKGTVVTDAIAGLGAACFLGDDLGDLPAFAALDRAADHGVRSVRVAVGTSETPAALLDRADLVVEGPEGALALLESLAD
jgi:trehalose 6-phosphate phosphatase